MKKAVSNSRNAGSVREMQAVSSNAKSGLTAGKPAPRPEAASPTPVWTRYVDSRLKQFCMR